MDFLQESDGGNGTISQQMQSQMKTSGKHDFESFLAADSMRKIMQGQLIEGNTNLKQSQMYPPSGAHSRQLSTAQGINAIGDMDQSAFNTKQQFGAQNNQLEEKHGSNGHNPDQPNVEIVHVLNEDNVEEGDLSS
jgi:hypothetical protein